MTSFVTADATSGVISGSFSTTMTFETVLEHWPLDGAVAVETAQPMPTRDFPLHRVVEGTVVSRAAMEPVVSATSIAADGLAECVITGLPNPCGVSLRGQPSVQVAGGSITLTSTEPGPIAVLITADPTHAPWEITIHAV